jgi:hypothetical protein
MNTSLREALAERIDAVGPARPDINTLVGLGEGRLRRRRRTRFLTAAAAAVLVAGSVYGVTEINSRTTNEPGPSNTTHSSSTPTQAYQMLVGDDAKGDAIHAQVTLHGFWGADPFPVISGGARAWGGLAVYRPDGLAAGNGCLGGKETTKMGKTPEKLAQQLALLPRSTVLQPATQMQRFGRHALHLRLRINPDCGTNVYRLADTISGSHGISYGPSSRRVIIDFWVEEVGGVPVVVESWHHVRAPRAMVDQIAGSLNSLTFSTGQ